MQHTTWIWNEAAPATNCYVDFAAELTLEELPAAAELAICADSEYAVWINGAFVNCGQYHCFPAARIYDSLPVAEYFTPGKNRLCITVYYQGEQSYQYVKGDPGLWFVLTSGSRVLAQSDSTVLSAPSLTYAPGAHMVTLQYGYGFVYNAAKEDAWRTPQVPLPERFSASRRYEGAVPAPRPIQKCVIQPLQTGVLLSQGIFTRTREDANPAVAIYHDAISYRVPWEVFEDPSVLAPKTEENFFVVMDLGREIAGYVTLALEAEQGTVVDIAWGEHIDCNGVATYIAGRSFANRYIAKQGKQTFTHYFRRIGGRYLQLHIVGKVTSINTVGIYESLYPVKLPPLPATGDRLTDRILQISRETLRQCMHEHYEDCPWREQGLYAGDSRNQMLCGYYAFHETAFPRACLDLMGQSMRPNGFLGITALTDDALQIPSFTFIWMISMAEYIAYTGDLSLAERYFPAMLRTVRSCTRDLPQGIAVHPFGKGIWHFYEWSEGCNGGTIYQPDPWLDYEAGHRDGLYQMFLYAALSSTACIAEALGLTEIRRELKDTMAVLKQGIRKVFWNDEKQRFASFVDGGQQNHYCQLMQAMAVFNSIADEHTNTLCRALTEDKDLVKITLSYNIYLYEALLMQGDTYREYVLEDIIEKWGKMLYAGATTFWETEDGASAFGGAGSLCHGWSAVPLYIYGRFFQGISPEDFRKQ